MNKSEKLLAARKRLKEFQLSKKSHVTYGTVKGPEHGTVKSELHPINNAVCNVDLKPESQMDLLSKDYKNSTNHCQASGDSSHILESHYSTEFNTNCNGSSVEANSSDLLSADRFFQDSVDIGGGQLVSEITDVVSKNQLVQNLNDMENDYCGRDVVTVSKDAHHTQPEIFIKDGVNDGKNFQTSVQRDQSCMSDEYSSFGSHALHREYLLQMTSAVTNVLTNDDSEFKDMPQEFDDLEQQNQFLATSLQEHKQTVNKLHVEVSQYKTRISELETVIATKDADFETRHHRELNPLKEQLHLHVQTTGILVGEKAELTAALLQSQTTVKQKVAEVEELNGKLKALQIQLYELDREVNSVKDNSEYAGKENHQLQSSFNTLENKYCELEQAKDDLELETAELKQKLNVKNTELMNVQEELKEKTALLSLNELRIQQMTSLSQETKVIGEQYHVVAALEQQLSQLMETLKAVSSERDEASSHYQNYVQQLNAQVTTLASKLEQTTNENLEISSRERSLIQRLADLECQIQSHKETPQPPPAIVKDNEEQIGELQKSIDQLTAERDSLRITLYEKDSDIDTLKRALEELQEMRNSKAEASRLVSALEGERLAATRAVSQNQQLKHQLSEMQDAFVQLSNAKLDLTEQLQGERAIGRKLNARLNSTEDELDRFKKEIQLKDLLLTEFEKDKLHAAQINDQMQHYQAQSHQVNTLQQELHKAQERIEDLSKQNLQLTNELNEQKRVKRLAHSIESLSELEGKGDSDGVNQIVNETAEISTTSKRTESQSITDDGLAVTSEKEISATTPEAVKKLEERFKDTMERVAELSDEKQRLEHLVLQLQSETETIGEYVTLYQKQRGVLQERSKEKDEAFRQLSEQRNQQQEQLHKLKMLVSQLIKEKALLAVTPVTTLNEIDYMDGKEKIVNRFEAETSEQAEMALANDKTTSEILDLLTEIKECRDTCASEPNFHPCPWCSGKLITV